MHRMTRRSATGGKSPQNNQEGSKRKRQDDDEVAGGDTSNTSTMPTINQQFIDLLQTQNGLLRSIDSRLGRMESQGRHLARQPQGRGGALVAQQATVQGLWKFAKSEKFDSVMKHHEQKACRSSILL